MLGVWLLGPGTGGETPTGVGVLLGPVTETAGRLTDHPMLSVTKKKKNKQQNLKYNIRYFSYMCIE